MAYNKTPKEDKPLLSTELESMSEEAIDLELKKRQLRKEREKDSLEDEIRNQQLRHRKMNALNMDNQRKKMEALQRGCSHLKKNGESYLAGQRDHHGVLHLICQGCMKHFLGHEVPIHIRPDADKIGGPEVVSTPQEQIERLYGSPSQIDEEAFDISKLDIPPALMAMK